MLVLTRRHIGHYIRLHPRRGPQTFLTAQHARQLQSINLFMQVSGVFLSAFRDREPMNVICPGPLSPGDFDAALHVLCMPAVSYDAFRRTQIIVPIKVPNLAEHTGTSMHDLMNRRRVAFRMFEAGLHLGSI